MFDEVSFSYALKRALEKEKEDKGIGTLGEKLLHRTLKYYLEPDESCHEISCYGSVADIKNESGVIEIQTRSFVKLVPKLERFLERETVMVVYPIIINKVICRINTETGETLPARKSPKRGRLSDALAELSTIRRFIPHDRLKILIVTVDVTETRTIDKQIRVGRKKTSKINCIPTQINEMLLLSDSEDYRQLLPIGLPQSFTSFEFEKYSGLHNINAHSALMLLLQLGIITRERKGREPYIYSVK